MRTYVVRRSRNGPPPLVGDRASRPWAEADVAWIDQYPWYREGRRQATEVRVLYDEEAIYLQFICEDRNIYSHVTQVNGPVCKDSCVEFFASTDPMNGAGYFNFEVNCCRAVHLGYGSRRWRRRLIDPALVSRIAVRSSVAGATRSESPGDRGWWLAAAIPLDLLGEFTRRPVRPAPGTAWRGNFYRCGGRVDQQFACWNWVGCRRPNFHRPDFFGDLRFA